MLMPKIVLMLKNRRNFFIVFAGAVLLYAAFYYSRYWSRSTQRISIPVDSSETNVELRPVEFNTRNLEELKTPKAVPLKMTAITKTTSSTISTADIEKKTNVPNTINKTLNIIDNNGLFEGKLARLKTILQCNDKDFFPQTEQRGEYWVLKNYVRADHGTIPCHESITYTTHASFEFLDNVLPLVERWMAPISLAIYAPGADMAPTVNSIRYLRDCLESDLVRQYVTFHVFFSNKHIPASIPYPEEFLQTPYNCSGNPPYVVNTSTTYMKQESLSYPVNVARNVARDAALTYFFLPSDIELYPSPSLVPRFLDMIARNEKPLNTSTNPRVFPIPIFEVNADVQIPSTKTQLQHMLANKSAIPFHKFMCPKCHSIPEGDQWKNAPETDQMDVFYVGKRRGDFKHWEPIFIGTHRDPYYDERLSWEGKRDKMTQSYILCIKDYDFMILNNAFLTHKPGIKKYVKNYARDTMVGRQSSFIDKVIVPEIHKLFGTREMCAL